jgi:tetratricopeptide (TPR) repeat protein
VAVIAAVLAACATLGVGDSVDSLMQEGKDAHAAGRYDEAVAKFEQVVRRDPRNWVAYLYLARSYVARQVWGSAVASARKALELAPSQAEVVPVLADSLVGAGADALGKMQFREAIGYLVEYVKLRPTDTRAQIGLARAYVQTGAYTDALRAFGQALTQDRDGSVRGELVQGLVDLGRAAWQAGDRTTALAAFQQVLRVAPGNLDALRFLQGAGR